jgi:hypothetical protein
VRALALLRFGHERYINAKYQGGPDLQVPIDNSSTTPGVFAANPFRPIFNPYTHRPIYQNKRYLKQKRTRTSSETNKTNSPINNRMSKSKFRHRKGSEEVGKRKSRMGKYQLARTKTLHKTALQPRKAKQDHKHTQQKTTKRATRKTNASATRQTNKSQPKTNYLLSPRTKLSPC